MLLRPLFNLLYSLAQLFHSWVYAVQIIDAMWKPSGYDWVYPLSYLFTFSIATPHSILVQLSYPKGNLLKGEPNPSCFGTIPALRQQAFLLPCSEAKLLYVAFQ